MLFGIIIPETAAAEEKQNFSNLTCGIHQASQAIGCSQRKIARMIHFGFSLQLLAATASLPPTTRVCLL
jgi:hypothetical protein